MSGSISTIDLSLLPPPQVVETIDYEALARQMLSRLTSLDANFADLLESDPAAKVLEAVAYGRMLDRQRVNEAALAIMLPYARSTDLDNIGDRWDVKRLQVGLDRAGKPLMEEDDRFRRRIRLAPEAKGAAGSPGSYVYWALTLAPAITDASAVQTSPGAVTVTLLGAAASGLPTAAELTVVRAAFADPATAKRPLTDAVTVAPPEVVGYAIDADLWLLPGPDASLLQGKSAAALAALMAERRKLGFDMPRSALDAALHQPGMSRVDLNAPAANVIVTPRQIALPTGGTVLRLAGRTI